MVLCLWNLIGPKQITIKQTFFLQIFGIVAFIEQKKKKKT